MAFHLCISVASFVVCVVRQEQFLLSTIISLETKCNYLYSILRDDLGCAIGEQEMLVF